MGTKYNSQCNNCTLYPGEYFPMVNAAELLMELKKAQNTNVGQPSVNVSEQGNYFKVEAAIPGLKREDFFIDIHDDILSISVLHKNIGVVNEKDFKLHEFNYTCFSRSIILPENIDSEFVNAEYKEGILNVYLPKAGSSTKHSPTHVVVY